MFNVSQLKPRISVRRDTIPVRYCARAIYLRSRAAGTIGIPSSTALYTVCDRPRRAPHHEPKGPSCPFRRGYVHVVSVYTCTRIIDCHANTI